MMKTAVVTGASGGIGSRISLCLAKKGYNVVLCYNTSEKTALETVAEIEKNGNNAIALRCDVRNKNETDALMKTVFDKYGRIDVLVNNAGVSLQKLFVDVSEKEYDEIFDTNVRGTINCSQSALKYMINQKSGSIVNISSMWGVNGASCEAHYSASKAAIIGLTKALAKEMGLSNIRVNCVAPGMIDTKMNAAFSQDVFDSIKEETPLNKIGKPEDVAKAVSYFASDDSSFVTGQVLCVDGGYLL